MGVAQGTLLGLARANSERTNLPSYLRSFFCSSVALYTKACANFLVDALRVDLSTLEEDAEYVQAGLH